MRNQREINNFYVFYRISDNGNTNKDKLDCATKINCLKNALEVFKKARIRVYIDNVIEITDKAIHELCDNLDNVDIKYLECKSNPRSFRAVYEDALTLNNNDFVYFLEDDYLHLSDSFEVLKEAAEMNYTDYITLYDHPDKYDYGCVNINPYCRNFGEQTVIFRTENHHWKVTNSTTMTFGAFVDVLRRDKEVFWKNTSTNISKDFEIFLELRQNGFLLSSPIPSLSTHCEKKFLAPFINWESVTHYEPTCCIVVITHKEALDGNDEKSFIKALDTFKNRDIVLIIPDNISTDYYDEIKKKYNFNYTKVDKTWLDSNKSYNKMCCTKEFYKLFKDYDYILLYQTDCWVFEDKLDELMELGYDYYGAPWPHHHDIIGNGGFSLRKVNKMLELTSKYEYNPKDSLLGNEDAWFCLTHKDEINTCDLDTACNFSIEIPTRNYLSRIKTHPMGLHGTEMRKLWDENGNKFEEFKNLIL